MTIEPTPEDASNPTTAVATTDASATEAAPVTPVKKKKRSRLGLTAFVFAILLLLWIGGGVFLAFQGINNNVLAGQIALGMFGASAVVIPLFGFLTFLFGLLAIILNRAIGKILGVLAILILIALIVAIVVGIGLAAHYTDQFVSLFGGLGALTPLLNH